MNIKFLKNKLKNSNMYKKRGQISVFFIIGAVLILIVVLGYFSIVYFAEKPVVAKANLPADLDGIEPYVQTCLTFYSEVAIREIALNGGVLRNIPSTIYYGSQFNFHNQYLLGMGFVSYPITRELMEYELKNRIVGEMINCDLAALEQTGFDVQVNGNITADAAIGSEKITISLDFPITVTKGNQQRVFSDFYYESTTKLGMLYDLSMMIIKETLVKGFFDEDEWMRRHNGIIIKKHQPYPDTVYSLVIDEENQGSGSIMDDRALVFNFAIKGKDSASIPSLHLLDESIRTVCLFSRDNNCFYNYDESSCIALGGEWTEGDDVSRCNGLSIFKQRITGKDCSDAKNGESWCIYDGLTGYGLDPVGSRHYKMTCIDGEYYYTGCRDYREEICTEYEQGKAVCRSNRWQDCALQTSQEECENKGLRDCYWAEDLVKADPYRRTEIEYDYSNRRCLPHVPPGLKIWQGSGEQVCWLANEQNNCKNAWCNMTWIESTAVYCYFMGDCGNYFNYAKDLTRSGFHSTDTLPRDYIYEIPMSDTAYHKLTFGYDYERQLDGDEFDFPQGRISNMKALEDAYERRMHNTPHVSFNSMPPSIEMDIESMHSAYCSVWQPPLGNSNCEACNNDPLKPCSEYRCRTLGSTCIFNNDNGVGTCSAEESNDTSIDFAIYGAYVLEEGMTPSLSFEKVMANEINNHVAERIQLQPGVTDTAYGYYLGLVEKNKTVLLIIAATTGLKIRISKSTPGHAGEIAVYNEFAHVGYIPIFIQTGDHSGEDYLVFVNITPLPPLEIHDFNGSQIGSYERGGYRDNADLLDTLSLAPVIRNMLKSSTSSFEKWSTSGEFSDSQIQYADNQMEGLGGQVGLKFGQYSSSLSAIQQNTFEYMESFAANYSQENEQMIIEDSLNRVYHFIQLKKLNSDLAETIFISYTINE